MRRLLSVAAIAALVLSTPASAQRGRASGNTSSGDSPIELGADAVLSFGLGATAPNVNVTTFQFPLSQLRAGFFISPQLSIEPSLGIQYASATGGSVSTYDLGIGALYHFSTVRTQSQIYVRPFLDFRSASGSGGGQSNSASSIAFGAGLGIKIPATDRISWRLEANLAHNNNNNFDDSPNRLNLLAGFSYFTH